MVHKVGQFQILSFEFLRQSGNVNASNVRNQNFPIFILHSLYIVLRRDKLSKAYLFTIQNGDEENW